MPDSQLQDALRPVCSRMKLQAALDLAVKGLAAAALITFGVAMCRIALPGWWPTIAALAVLSAGPLVGLVFGLLSRPDLPSAARLVDDRYRLDDRTASAVAAERAASRPMAQLLLRDTLERLKPLQPGEVVPLRWPRGVLAALLLAAFAIAVALLPLDLESYWPSGAGGASSEAVNKRGGPGMLPTPPESSPLEIQTSHRLVTRHSSEVADKAESCPPASIEREVIVERYFADAQPLNAN